MYTEKEARFKQCPQMLDVDESEQTTCLGSMCMAWRWTSELDGDQRKGYCGLAGRPHD